jgi:hypothetical protein
MTVKQSFSSCGFQKYRVLPEVIKHFANDGKKILHKI